MDGDRVAKDGRKGESEREGGRDGGREGGHTSIHTYTHAHIQTRTYQIHTPIHSYIHTYTSIRTSVHPTYMNKYKYILTDCFEPHDLVCKWVTCTHLINIWDILVVVIFG